MSRHAESPARGRASRWRWLLALLATPAGAQSIADYSHAQRAAIEAAMTQAAARAATTSTTPQPPAASAAAASSAPNAPSAFVPRRSVETVEPAIQIDGVFATASSGFAEINVDGRAHLLTVGQPVPGTRWHVESIDVDRVVLTRGAVGSPARAGESSGRRIFALPALR